MPLWRKELKQLACNLFLSSYGEGVLLGKEWGVPVYCPYKHADNWPPDKNTNDIC